jgi:DNA-binding NarL/FixJ family response regulator
VQGLSACTAHDYPAAIIADLSLCQRDNDTRAAIETLRERFSPPPHLFCLASGDDFSARLDAVRLGATRFLKKPVDSERLIAILKGVTAQTPSAPFRVLFIDDDRSIVRDIGDIGAGGDSSDNSDDLAIVEGIVKIARGFNREVIAKGVESRAQADQLMHLGCHVMQGHAIARPMPADALAEWLASRVENPGDGAQG